MICDDLQIGSTLARRTSLRAQGIPAPDSWTYQPYSVVKLDGDGKPKGFGMPSFTWVWETLSQLEIDVLLDLIPSGEASEEVFVQTYTDEGPGPQTTAAGKAWMSRPIDGQGKSMISETRKPVYNGVTLTFTHLDTS